MGMTILIVSVTSLYFPLNRKLTGGFNLSTRLDNWIPLWPVWAAGLIWAAWKMDEDLFRSFASACLFVQVSAMLSFYFFPTYVKRPVLTAGNWATQILQMVYRNDGDYNAFPSGHVYQTALICLFYNQLYPNHTGVWIGIVVIVALSTLFTRQHYLVDTLGGLVIAWIGYRLGLYLFL